MLNGVKEETSFAVQEAIAVSPQESKPSGSNSVMPGVGKCLNNTSNSIL